MTNTPVLAERLTSQLLAGPPARDPVAVARRLLAIQAQDPRAARLAVRARSAGLSVADVDRALSDRSMVISWLNRGTLHLVASEDHAWLHALTTPPQVTANARRLAQLGVSPSAAERAVAAIERALAEEGPLTRAQLAERIAAAGVSTEGQALVHLLMLATLRGLIVRGPMVGRHHAFALVRDWLGPPAAVSRGPAQAELARRYLAGHAWASDRDLSRWAGLPLRDARAGLQAIASELDHRDGLVALKRRGPAGELPPPRLLGSFEPMLLGWGPREVLPQGMEAVVTLNGIIRPFALVRGRGAAVWRLAREQLELEPFGALGRREVAALERDAADVSRFLSGTAPAAAPAPRTGPKRG